MQTQLLTGLLAATFVAPVAVKISEPPRASSDVVAIHENMLDALDRSDESALRDVLRDMLSDSSTLYVLDENARPVTLSGSLAAASYLALWARDIEDPAPAKLLSCSVVTESPAVTVVVFEFERPTSGVRYLRATSTLVPASTACGFCIEHLHVSTASGQDAE